MKKQICFIILIFAGLSVYSQTEISEFVDMLDDIYATIDANDVPTGLLLDQGFREIDDFIISENIKSDYNNYYVIYNNLQRCKHGMPDVEILPVFENLVNWDDYSDNLNTTIPLSYIFYKGNYLGTQETTNLLEDFDYTPAVSEKKFFALSVMIPSVYNYSVTFDLKSELVFTNAGQEINRLEIDFGDGVGFRNITYGSANISVNYSSIGEKQIISRLITGNDTLIANSKVMIKTESISTPSGLKASGTVPNGNYRYEVGDDNILDRPILIVEGFDLMNNYSENSLYSDWSPTLSDLKTAGYDLYCLSFNNAKLSMHQNKEVVKAMINKINDDKTGNFEGIIIGESMGGVLARMALKEMENDNIDHQMGLYVSFDSPHKGANVPPGIQHGFEDLAEIAPDVGSNAAELLLPSLSIFQHIFGDISSHIILEESLNSTAARELLSRHTNGSVHFDNMQADLSNLGYPENSRNVALINGNNQGDNLPFNPGDQIYNHQWKWTALLGHYHELTINSTAVNTTNQLVSNVTLVTIIIPDVRWYNFLGIPPIVYPEFTIRKGYFSSDNKAYDNCPGSIIDISALDVDIDTDIDAFCFIPVASAIDLDETIYNSPGGLNYLNSTNTKDDIINNNLTPFDDIYAGSTSTQHIQLFYQINNIKNKEIMFRNLYLQNRLINNDRDFMASNSITTGYDVDHQVNKNIETGDVIFSSGTQISLSAPTIILEAGTTIEFGCEFIADNQ